MSLKEIIIGTYPELADMPRAFVDGTILLQNDSDGTGDYIKVWAYDKPLTPELEEFYRP